MMKMTLTDGLNTFEAMEFERLMGIDFFGTGQKLLIQSGIEVRRGIFFLTSSKVSYLGDPPKLPQKETSVKQPGFL